MKPTLTKEEIQFIDTYLKNSDVRFADIRMEMVDHVASEIELQMDERDEDFRTVFINYMANNKKSLIKNSKKYYIAADKKLLIQLLKNIFSLNGILIILGSYYGVKVLWHIIDPDYVRKLPYLLCVFLPLVYLVDYKIYKKRYSYLERVCFYFMIYFNIANIVFKPFGLENLESAYDVGQAIFEVSLGIAFAMFLLQLGIQNYKSYKTKYKALI